MQLKENTKYRRRDGVVVGPLSFESYRNYPWWDIVNGISYLDNGRERFDSPTMSDLVAEVNEKPNDWKCANEGISNGHIEVIKRDGSIVSGLAHTFHMADIVAWRPIDQPAPLTLEQRLARLEDRVLGL
jgi:hypothetical protein